jgi:hypothetical protein
MGWSKKTFYISMIHHTEKYVSKYIMLNYSIGENMLILFYSVYYD